MAKAAVVEVLSESEMEALIAQKIKKCKKAVKLTLKHANLDPEAAKLIGIILKSKAYLDLTNLELGANDIAL